MIPFLLHYLVAITTCLAYDLNSIKRNLFRALKPKATYDGAEYEERFRIFSQSVDDVMRWNADSEDGARYEVNFFSFMTAEEKAQYLGLNVSQVADSHRPVYRGSGNVRAPREKLWVRGGFVTKVKDQDKPHPCSSCWAFAGAAVLETRYKIKTGVLQSLSAQEYLDCAPAEGRIGKDGCRAGWHVSCFHYSKEHGGRPATQRDYPYVAQYRGCDTRNKADGLISYHVNDYKYIERTEAANVNALASGPLACVIKVTKKLQQYSEGILKDWTCMRYRPDHAMTMVGYTTTYILVKNSWGTSWGDLGFVKFARNYDFYNCGLYQSSSYPILKYTNKIDTRRSEEPCTYDPNHKISSHSCYDLGNNCGTYLPVICQLQQIGEKYCRFTCNICDTGHSF